MSYLKNFFLSAIIIISLFLVGTLHAATEIKKDISFHITYPQQKITITPYDEVFLEGEITAPHGIVRIELEGQDLFNIKNLPDHYLTQSGQHTLSTIQGPDIYYLNHTYLLDEDFSIITLKVEDARGTSTSKQFCIQKIPTLKSFKRNERMILALVPLALKSTDINSPTGYMYNKLIKCFSRQKRFNLLESTRLPWVLIEKALSEKDISQEALALQISEITSAKGIIFLTMEIAHNGTEIHGSLVDPDTGEILLIHKVFAPVTDFINNCDFDKLNSIISGLAIKFRDSFPLHGGTIIQTKERSIYLDLGSKENVLPSMRCNIFKD
ncbi:MAG: hypothetical protein ACMUJM_09855 [bacterium]